MTGLAARKNRPAGSFPKFTAEARTVSLKKHIFEVSLTSGKHLRLWNRQAGHRLTLLYHVEFYTTMTESEIFTEPVY
jgi:hypothetical protein